MHDSFGPSLAARQTCISTTAAATTAAANPPKKQPIGPSTASTDSISISLVSSSSSVSGSGAASSHPREESTISVSVTPRVVFGAGAVAHLPTELGRLSLSSPLIVSSPSRIGLARHIQELIPNFDSRILDSALVSVPARVVDDAVARITGRDCVVSVGGATALGLAKSIAACKGIPHICIPTTYSGSEVGPVLSEARRRARRRRHRHTDKSTSGTPSVSTASVSKGTDHDAKMLPNVIIYDEDLTASAPRRFSAPTCVEAMASSRCRRAPGDEDAQWSYIHLPGV